MSFVDGEWEREEIADGEARDRFGRADTPSRSRSYDEDIGDGETVLQPTIRNRSSSHSPSPNEKKRGAIKRPRPTGPHPLRGQRRASEGDSGTTRERNLGKKSRRRWETRLREQEKQNTPESTRPSQPRLRPPWIHAKSINTARACQTKKGPPDRRERLYLD